MKRKFLTFIISICLSLSTVFSLTGCKEAKIGERDWPNLLGYFSHCPNFTLYEYTTGKAFTYSYPRGNLETVLNGGDYLATVYVSNEFRGSGVDDSKIVSMDYSYSYDVEKQEKFLFTPINGMWNNYDEYGNVISTITKEQVEYDEPCKLYPWLINFARNNYSQFTKSYEDDNSLTYSLKEENLGAVTDEINKVYGETNVKGLSLIFEKDVYTQDYYDDSSDLYKLDAISVKGQDGLLFTMKNIDSTIFQGEFDLTMKNLMDKSNFTLKGGEGVDYGEYYFTKNAIKIYTPNNPDATQREGYLVADYENQTAKFIKKTPEGSWDVQNISLGAFENRKQELIKVYLGGIINGYGNFKKYSDVIGNDGYPTWAGSNIQKAMIGYDLTYNNVKIKLMDNSRTIKEMTFDYVMTAGENSLTHHFELNNCGSTTVNIPQI